MNFVVCVCVVAYSFSNLQNFRPYSDALLALYSLAIFSLPSANNFAIFSSNFFLSCSSYSLFFYSLFYLSSIFLAAFFLLAISSFAILSLTNAGNDVSPEYFFQRELGALKDSSNGTNVVLGANVLQTYSAVL